jgi:hypothetical protein
VSQTQYALGPAGLKPGQFQLGIKNFPNVGNPALQRSDPAKYKKLRNASTLQSPAQVAARAKDLLRPHGVGLVIFAMGTKDTNWDVYRRYNEGLNAGADSPGTVGQPLQGPLSQASAARLQEAAQRDSR